MIVREYLSSSDVDKKIISFILIVIVVGISCFFLGSNRHRNSTEGIISKLESLNSGLKLSLEQAEKQSIGLEGQLERSREEAHRLRNGLEGISTALSGLGTAVGEGFDNLDELDRIIGEIERRLRETGIFDNGT